MLINGLTNLGFDREATTTAQPKSQLKGKFVVPLRKYIGREHFECVNHLPEIVVFSYNVLQCQCKYPAELRTINETIPDIKESIRKRVQLVQQLINKI